MPSSPTSQKHNLQFQKKTERKDIKPQKKEEREQKNYPFSPLKH